MWVLLREATGTVLRRVRIGRAMTLRELAATACCSPAYLSEIERGRKEPSSEVLAAVAAALEVPLPTLLVEVVAVLAAGSAAAAA